MIAAARGAGVRLIVGHSHSFDTPVLRARELIRSGVYGALRMITALDFTDFVYRPRRPDELAAGAVLNQAAHHVDIARLLAGSRVRSVRAFSGDWDAARPTQGAYAVLLGFDSGACASLVYSGYAHFDSDEFMGWIGEMGQRKDASTYGAARRALSGDERALKDARNYGGPEFKEPQPITHQHFGPLIVSCDKADLRPLPSGVMIHGDDEQRLEPLPPTDRPRSGVIDELYDAVVNGKAPLHDAAWGLATTEACLAILESAKSGKEIPLKHQTNAWRT
jgi:phthalate 4,5-cis-dihydrodiol dehydrogenase